MIDALKSLLGRHATPAPQAETPSGGHDDRALHIAACALLLELAHADDEFTPDERRHVEEALVRHFDLPIDAARELMELAERERSEATDLYRFTSLINEEYDEGQRMVLIEVLWRVVYADGKLSKHEDYLMRKLANLLELRPGYLAEARNRAQKKRG